ncbi:MAG TPA: glycosyltransferase [Chitinophagales bacterium]|nr:glycosyltransferase [Chitinophagales bacterium]
MGINKEISVSVLMTAYNAENYVKEAIQSILEQTYSDFEFVIINDGSTDKTLEIIQSFDDKRIRIINEGKFGYYKAKRRLIEEAKGKYIAIMDADDIADKNRFEAEVDFLDKHPDFGLVGTNATWIDKDNKPFGKGFNFSYSPEELKCRLLFHNCFVHSSVLIRKSILDKYQLNYREKASEDLDLWVQISRYIEVKNIPKKLIKYRIHSNSIVHSNWYKKDNGLKQITFEQLDYYFPEILSVEEKNAIFGLVNFDVENDNKVMSIILKSIQKLLQSNQKNEHFNDIFFRKVIQERWFKKIIRLKEYSSEIWKTNKECKEILDIPLTPKQHLFEIILILNIILKKRIIKV